MKFENRFNSIFLFSVVLIYALLTVECVNHCYFWDSIQQISKEAHWFYSNDFKSLLMPTNSGAEIVATGYHPPLMGIMTAVLWKVFGYKIWVSHVFIFFWALILIYNVWKIIKSLFPEKYAGWVLLITMLESTLLTQFSISSPDFILFTAFVISVRSVLENKILLLSIGVFFLCCINMRGIFVGLGLFIIHFYYYYLQNNSKQTIHSIIKIVQPYLPTFLILVGYFTYYFIVNGWFFSNSTENGHYSVPSSSGRIIRHLAEFGLRSIENGRIIIWIIGIYSACHMMKTKTKLTNEFKTLLLFFLLLNSLYFLFVFITQMPFSARYFMPQFFLLSILVLMGMNSFFNENKMKIALILILIFEISGNFWIYPEKIAKSWDCTLAHLPYYELRKECFDYIDYKKIDYKDISAGFCIYGKRDFIELSKNENSIGNDINSKYFIYSNISNLEDSLIDSFHDRTRWIPIKKFEKGSVFVTLYKNTKYQ